MDQADYKDILNETEDENDAIKDAINKAESNNREDEKEKNRVDETNSETDDGDDDDDDHDHDHDDEEEDPDIVQARENILLDIAYAEGLDAVMYCREDVKDENSTEPPEEKILTRRLNMKVSTWMLLYNNLDEPDEFNMMRDVSIGIGDVLRGFPAQANEFGSFEEKYKVMAPYNFFLTSVAKQPTTYEQHYSVAFHEILDHSLGILDESLHICSTVDVSWIISEYMIACQIPRMAVIYEKILDPATDYTMPFRCVKLQQASGTGSLHSKISLLKYKDKKIRIVISTANLHALDWSTRTNGFWISPFLPLLPDDADDTDGESPTNFKNDFIEYLREYKEPQVFGWLCLLHRTNFSAVKVFFVGSVPGIYNINKPDSKYLSWGQKRIGALLSKHAVLSDDAEHWPVVAQCSAVDSYGPNYNSWLHSTVCEMAKNQKGTSIAQQFMFVFPSQSNFKGSYDDELGKTSLQLSREVYNEQSWLNRYMYQWIAKKTDRTSAIPYIKCYTRISPDSTEIPWFLLTSSDLSKDGFGITLYESDYTFSIKNYEAGVLFIPTFLIGQNTFPITEMSDRDKPLFLLPYDVPLTQYNKLEDGCFEEPYITTAEPSNPEENGNDVNVDSELSDA